MNGKSIFTCTLLTAMLCLSAVSIAHAQITTATVCPTTGTVSTAFTGSGGTVTVLVCDNAAGGNYTEVFKNSTTGSFVNLGTDGGVTLSNDNADGNCDGSNTTGQLMYNSSSNQFLWMYCDDGSTLRVF